MTGTTDFALELPLQYIETTIPAGVTVAQYRRSRSRKGHGRGHARASTRGRWWRRLALA
jgi:hypothetical protein